MLRFHIVHNLRTAVWLILFALIPLCGAGLYWANKTGLPDEWREAIEQEISKHGVHVKIAALTYVPLRGVIAQNVRIFAEPERIHEISRLERAELALDYAKLAGGEFRIRKAVLRNARLLLPVDPKKPSGDSLGFTGIYGTIMVTEDNAIEIRDGRGEVGGVGVTVAARLRGGTGSGSRSEDEKNEGRRREVIARILSELKQWDFGTETQPKVHVDINGNLKDKASIKADFRIEAASVEKQQYRLENLSGRGSLDGYLLTVSSFSAQDARGNISGHADYRLGSKEGRFDIESSIDIPRLLKSWLSAPIGVDLLIGGGQRLQAAGDFDLHEDSAPSVHLTGHALCESVMFRGVSFDSLETWFSWQDGDLFLRDLKLTRPDGAAEAKLLVQDSKARLALHSTLPAPLFKPFFPGQPLEIVIGDFTENENPSTEIFLEGSFDLKDRHAWDYKGHGTVRNLSYRGVPVKSAGCSFRVNHGELDFHDGSVTFDYSRYPLRKAHGGPREGTASVGRIRYDAPSKTIGVEAVSGDIWAAPMVRFFAPKIADDLEQYRFHRPPSLSGSGVVDVTPQGRTDLTVKFSTSGKADYKFLGEDITVSEPEATVSIKGDTVAISGLSLGAFDGTVAGDLLHSGKSRFGGELSWSKLSMPALATAYDFEMEGGGLVTGRIEFGITGADARTMSGQGLMGLEDAALFSVPVFGPLSPVMAAVLNDKRMGFERAKSAFFTFDIKDGILRTRDFQTATTSVTFAGDGEVDLAAKTIDFTIRLNARGLLGLLTLPLRPFYGLFQFRGTGLLGRPDWENVHFTSPPEAQKEILLKAPPRALVVPE
ncbi:hypothetical protein HZ994_15920 [Akkermansiaceae bacterium]|nr:hypothetical protein HZ994_15920 [Akkermansiaceae bacterium]